MPIIDPNAQTYLLLVLTVIAVVVVCVVLPWWMTKPPKVFPDSRLDARDRFRQTIAQALGGIAVLVAFVWTFTKDRETLQLSNDQQANNQFFQAAMMLKEQSVSTRTAAIYALGALGQTAPALREPIRQTLAAVLSSPDTQQPAVSDDAFAPRIIDQAAESAVKILGSDTLGPPDPRWRLAFAHRELNGAKFHDLAGFRLVNFEGSALHATDFRCADLSGAQFYGAHLADFEAYKNWQDRVAETDDWEGWRKYRFIANFEGANLRGAQFQGALLSGAKFAGADLADADFSRANLSRADFSGARNIAQARFADAQGSACADAEPRFDDGAKSLPACKAAAHPYPHRWLPNEAGLSYSADRQLCQSASRSQQVPSNTVEARNGNIK